MLSVTGLLNGINTHILNPLIILLFAIATVVFIWGLVQFISGAGVDEKREPFVTNVKEFIGKGKLNFGKDGIILGNEIKKGFNITLGETVTLISPNTQKAKDFVVVDVFNSGRYDYDSNVVLISLESAKELFGPALTGFGVRVKDEFDVNRVKNAIKENLGFRFSVRSWQDLDRNLMRAIAVEKRIMFFINQQIFLMEILE